MQGKWVLPAQDEIEAAGRRALALAWCARRLGMDPECGAMLYRAGDSWWIATADRVRQLRELEAGSPDDALRALHRILREVPDLSPAAPRTEDRVQLSALGEQLSLGGVDARAGR